MIVDSNPEFGIELATVIPYAYWLSKQGKLDGVVTSKGMAPFYFFCDNVVEMYESRTIDNEAAGMGEIPNSWIYGFKDNAALYKDTWEHWWKFSDVERGCGILDYSKWEMPDYVAKFKSDTFKSDKPTIVISNRYNFEHGQAPLGYFDIECLYLLFTYLSEQGYNIIYKRPNNTEFPTDQNEVNTIIQKYELTADVEGLGIITDYELTSWFPGSVTLLNDVVSKHPTLTYNEVQLQLFANADGFITMGGGSTLFPCAFKKPTVAYYGKSMSESSRDRFWKAEDGTRNDKNYHFMINPNLHPFIDPDGTDMLSNHYGEFLDLVKTIFKRV